MQLPQINSNENELGNQVRLHNQDKLYPNFSGNLTKEKTMKNITLKRLFDTDFDYMGVCLNTGLANNRNRVFLVRRLVTAFNDIHLVQVYIGHKTHTTEYALKVLSEGQWSQLFYPYGGSKGFGRVFDTAKYKDTGDYIIADSFTKGKTWATISFDIVEKAIEQGIMNIKK